MTAQFAAPPSADVLLVGHFRTPEAYDAVLAHLDAYYQEQLGRNLAIAFPRIAPDVHYETWHDMWAFFAPDKGSLNVTLECPTDTSLLTMAKGWMLEIAGRTGGELPPRFEQKPALRSVGGQIYGSRRDVARALASDDSLRLLETWHHAGLMVSANPLRRVELAASGPHGIHAFTVAAETASAARELAGKVSNSVPGPCVCSVYSETSEIAEEVRRLSVEKASSMGASGIYAAQIEPKTIESQLRSEPEMQRRLAGASGWFDVRYRVDKSYAKVNIRWTELAGYSRAEGKFASERELGASTVLNVKAPAQPGSQLTCRTKLGALTPGAYRIEIEGQSAAGDKVRVDQRDYWFDGKTFEEI